MGEIIDIGRSHKKGTLPDGVRALCLSHGADLVPVDVALGEPGIDRCLALIARYGRCAVYPRFGAGDRPRFFITVGDAIQVNQKMLDADHDSEQAMAARIDLIQLLENNDPALLWTTLNPPKSP